MRALNRDITGFAVANLIGEMRGGYADLPEVLEYLDAVERDIKDNVDDFLPQPQSQPPAAGAAPPPPRRKRRWRTCAFAAIR